MCVCLSKCACFSAYACVCVFLFLILRLFRVLCASVHLIRISIYEYILYSSKHNHKQKQYTKSERRKKRKHFEKSLRSRLQLIQNVVISSVEIARTFFKYMALLKCMRKNGWCAFFSLKFFFHVVSFTL